MVRPDRRLTQELATPSQQRQVWEYRPLASLTPAKVADILRRAATGDAYDFVLAADDILEKDLHYRAVLQTRILAVAGLPVDVQPYDDSAQAVRAADLVRGVLDRISMPALIAHLMDAVAKGYAVAEILWETSDRQWLPAAILPRPAQWFKFDATDGRTLRLVDDSQEGAEIPPYKCILHVPPLATGIPLLGGVARAALWAWVFKSYALRDWARFCELFGIPMRLGRYHEGATQEQIAELKKAIFDLGSDASAVLPEGMQIELIESSASAANGDLFHALIDYIDRQVSKAVLGQTMTTDDGSSYAQAKVHAEVRRDLLEADARAISATLMRDLVTPVVRLNLGEEAPLPTLSLLVEDTEDLSELADSITKLAGAGLTIPQWWVRERFGIPEAAEGDAVLGGQEAEEVGMARVAHAQTAGDDLYAQIPERMADRMEIEAESGWAAILDEVKDIVAKAESLPQLRDALLDAFGALPEGKLAEVMALGFAAADLAGRFAVITESGGDQ